MSAPTRTVVTSTGGTTSRRSRSDRLLVQVPALTAEQLGFQYGPGTHVCHRCQWGYTPGDTGPGDLATDKLCHHCAAFRAEEIRTGLVIWENYRLSTERWKKILWSIIVISFVVGWVLLGWF